ncbi:MAG: MAPEG family protein [Hyphomonadaceae bacterium]|nr:MAPEG family protein [Hyphomonadaceae bacterium]
MEQALIFQPMGALVALTFLVLCNVPLRRFRAVGSKTVTRDDFKFGESARVPGDVAIPNRNLMNLLELPILFYVLCLALFVSDRVTELQLWLAWIYVALRATHSLVHLTFNHVVVRLLLFGLSNFVLMAMWILFFVPASA